MMLGPSSLSMPGGSGRRGTQLRGCPPSFGLPLYAAALSAPSTRSLRQGWYASSANHKRLLPRVMRWVAQQNKERNWCLTPITLYAAALSAPSARSFRQGWCASSANHKRLLPRVMRWVAQQNKEGGRRPGDICGAIQRVAVGPQCVALDPQCDVKCRIRPKTRAANFRSPNRASR